MTSLNSMNIHFKEITLADLPVVLNLFKSAAERIAKKNIDHWQYWKNPPEKKVAWVKEGISNHEFFFILGNVNERIGMVRILEEDLMYWGEKNDKSKYIHSFVISEAHNGKGLGSKVLQLIESEAKESHYEYLRLDCDAKNEGLCKYYESQGFTKVGEKIVPLSTNNLYEKSLREY